MVCLILNDFSDIGQMKNKGHNRMYSMHIGGEKGGELKVCAYINKFFKRKAEMLLYSCLCGGALGDLVCGFFF